MKQLKTPVHLSTIAAGKFRRYHHLTVMRQLFWPRLVLANIRDAFLVGIGTIQSLIKLIIWRPDVVFTKGGYVCLPVGFAAHVLRIPLVIHDSDAHPGLTNRVLSTWATSIATGAPLKYYSYPAAISRYVGIPISHDYHEFSKDEVYAARKQWGISQVRPLVVVTGGGLGAKRINDAVSLVLDDLLSVSSVVLISGSWQYDELRSLTPEYDERFQLHGFVSEGMAQLLGAADIVIARAGATTLLELAALKKTTILIPNGKLTGGHQLKNAKVYVDAEAVLVIDEAGLDENPMLLVERVTELLSDSTYSQRLAKNLHGFARPRAARDVADMILAARK